MIDLELAVILPPGSPRAVLKKNVPVENACDDRQCHLNVGTYWAAAFPGDLDIVTGWALGRDGTWRAHSWLSSYGDWFDIQRPYTAHYGVILTPAEAEDFLTNWAASRQRLGMGTARSWGGD